MSKHYYNILHIFKQLFDIYSVNQDTFRKNAYSKIIDNLEQSPIEIHSIKDIKNINGIGNKTIIKMDEIIQTGHLKLLDDLKTKENIAKVELNKVLGIGPKFANKLVHDGIYTISQLKNSNISLNNTQKIGIKYYKLLNKPISRSRINLFHKQLQTFLKTFHLKSIIAGSYYRGLNYSNDIDVLIYPLSDKFDEIIQKMLDEKILIKLINKGKYNAMAIGKFGKIDLKMIDEKLLPFHLLYFSSGVSYSREIRKLAKKKGYRLSQYGLFNIAKNKFVKNNFNSVNDIISFIHQI